MKQNKRKRLLSLLVTLAMVIGLMQGMSLTAYADSAHTHDGITFVEWTDALAQAQNGSSSTSSNSLPSKPGNYYLTKDVTLMSGERWDVPIGETHLCLNNHGIIQKVGSNRNCLIRIRRYHVILNLYDSDTPKTTYTYSTAYSGITTVGGQGKTFTGGYITGGHGYNAGGVYIEGGTFNMYGGTIIGNRTGANGGGVCIAAGTFNMYDGAIIGNYGCDNNSLAPGGGGVYNNGTFNMFGGEISGNTCTHDGGGVFNNTRGIFTMSGSAKITNNRSGSYGGYYGGGGVFNKGTFNMEGGEISGNSTSYCGGGVKNEGTFKLYSNAIIRDNSGGTSADIEGTVTVVSESNANEPDATPTPTPTPSPVPTPAPVPGPVQVPTYAGGFYTYGTSSGSSSSSSSSSSEPAVVRAGMHRMFNPATGEHFYTASDAERDDLVGKGWSYEGIAFWVPKKSNTPVWRLLNPTTGEHYYTTDTDERDRMLGEGWSGEGVAWYADDAQGKAMYRLFDPKANPVASHHFTSSEAERQELVAAGWTDQGIGFYALG